MSNTNHTTTASPSGKSWAASLKPEDLAKHKRFADAKVKHPKLTEVIEQLKGQLITTTDSNIVLVTGATGVGKTTLSRALSKLCADMFHDVLDTDPSAIPAIVVEAYSNGDQRHGFKALYEDMLLELHEPAAQKKTFAEVVDNKLVMKPQSRTTVQTLRTAVQKSLKHRRTVVCAIDEAYHLLRFASEAAVMDTLKSLANTTGVTIVLIGSFDLFDLVVEHGQVARRTTIINFDRYHLTRAADRAAFRDVVKNLQAVWPCEQVPNLAAISDELMEASLGCVGLLKSFMLDAAALQMINGGAWKTTFLGQAAKSNALREAIRKEIEAGETKVKDAIQGACLWDGDALARLSERMGAVDA